MLATLAVIWAWALGVLIVVAMWPRDRALRADALLVGALGALVGLAVTSITFFFASLLLARAALVASAAEAVLAVFLVTKLRRRAPAAAGAKEGAFFTWPGIILATLATQAVFVAGILAGRTWRAEPYGGWDGWAIWNMNARLMLRAGPGWPRLLEAPQLSWTHPDYPRLVPGSVARAWAWAGAETPLASGLISAVFAAAAVALLVAAVAKLRGWLPALVGGVLLLATPFFATFSMHQHADIPLAAYMLAAVVLVICAAHDNNVRELPALAGLCAAFAAWTKNEGLLFAIVFAAAWMAVTWGRGVRRGLANAVEAAGSGQGDPALHHAEFSRRDWAGVGMFVGALVLGLLPVMYFKFFLAPAGDMLSGDLIVRAEQLFDETRHRLILSALGRDLGRFGEWHFAPYLAMALPFLAWTARRRMGPGEFVTPLVVLGMLAGYYFVYLMSPQDLGWHLDSSLVRLLLQLWPLALLGWCLAAPLPTMGLAPIARPRVALIGFITVNVAAVIAMSIALSGQLPAGELALRRVGGATIAAMPAEGWHGIERHEKTVWVWSRGSATLQLHAGGRSATEPMTLRFALRSLGPREVTVRMAERVLWTGRVDEKQFTQVEIPGLVLPAGDTAIEFATDTPGVREADAPEARTLAFAVYDFRMR